MHGQPLVPEGVDAEEWQMELPSILGLAWTGCGDSDPEVASADDGVDLSEFSCEEGAEACAEDISGTNPESMSMCWIPRHFRWLSR